MAQQASPLFRSIVTLISFFLACFFPVAVAAGSVESYGKLPLHFEANQGQAHEDVRYLSRGPGYSLYLTGSEAVLVLTQPNAEGSGEQVPSAALRMGLVGAARKPVVSGVEELPGKANYFIGNDPAKWRANVPTYAKVHYREVYPGIDLVYYGNQRQLEYDFVVAPGADPKRIVLAFRGADKLEIDAQGDLVLHMGGESILQKKPVIYQEVDGMRREIAGSYVRKGANRVSFKVAAYDASRPLVIDPVLAYSTYLGGSSFDQSRGVAVDATNHAYVTGWTHSTNFPTTAGALQPARGDDGRASDIFVTKLNPTGSGLVYSTYIGGGGSDAGEGIAVDSNGNTYVAGSTNSTNFPVTAGAFKPSYGGSGDAFVTKLNPAGSALVYSTYVGGSDVDGATAIAVDPMGNTYITGLTLSPDFPTNSGAVQPAFAGTADAFVTKLNSAGSALVYSTYLGGAGSDAGNGIATDGDGSAYVTGVTLSTDFPSTTGSFQPIYGGGNNGDAFVAKLDTAGSRLVYSTYLGGNGTDHGIGIAIDGDRNVYVTGGTSSTDFPTTAGAFQPVLGGGTDPVQGSGDAFVTKISPTGSAAIYSTYLGGASGFDTGRGIAVDTNGSAYVTGGTASTDFPTTAGAFQAVFRGFRKAFVTKLNPAGTGLVHSTYFGGGHTDEGYAVALDASRSVYVTGGTRSTDFPVTAGAFQVLFAGAPPSPGPFSAADGDGFVAKFTDGAPPSSGPQPFSGKPIAIPGTFEAENFDRGGEGVAYHDNVPGNAGGQYRPGEDVDIIASLDAAGGGFVVNNFETGEWLAYTVQVQASTSYSIELRAATHSAFPNSAYHIEIDGVNVTGTVVLPITGGWNNFQWVGKVTVQLPAGQHSLKIVSERQYFNLNQIRVAASASGTPFTGTPIPVPGSFEAENFDRGGEGVAYHDNVPGNAGGLYRTSEDVDIVASRDPASGGYVVNNFETGEWLSYTVNVQAAGNYNIELLVSSEFSNSAFHVEIDGLSATGTIRVPNTGSWGTFQWVGKQGVRLTAGQHVLKIVSDQQYFDLNRVRVTTALASTPFSGQPIQVPALIEAENFDRGGEGVAYHDNVPGNAGGQYRTGEDVDIVPSLDPAGGGFVVNNFETGEWLAYTILVPETKGYFLELRAATSSDFPNAAYRIEIDGFEVTGPIVLPDTGGWNNFSWIGRQGLFLTAGQRVLKIVSERQYFNLNQIRITNAQ
jgi:hypothetical protein